MLDILIYFWLLTILLFIYNLGRVYFTIVPVVENWIWTEEWDYYHGLNRDKFLIFLFITSLSVIFAYIFIPKIFRSDNWFDVICLLASSFLLQLLITFILERKAPASPFSMLENFIKHNFDFQVDNSKKIGISKNIKLSESFKRRNFQHGRQFFRTNKILVAIEKVLEDTNEIKEVVAANKFLLTRSEFIFEIKGSSKLILSNILSEYSISLESQNVLKDFLYRNKISGKIVFTKSAGTGPSVKEMFYFFSTFTNIFEMCKDKQFTQEEVKNIMNEIVVGTYKGERKENPISKDNISKYI